MLDASHAIIGASIAKLIPNPYLGFPLSLLSHFLADLCPHWDYGGRSIKRPKLKLIILALSDALIGFSLGYLIFSSTVPTWYLLSMMFTAQLPDWLEAPYHIFNFNFPPFSSIKKLQSKLHSKMDFPWGLVTQITIALIFVLATFI
ncbi:MAG: hypothetical protein ABIJ43_05980 [Candidatus Beckwithbacteria bacterium]|nr:hypothetical protein [Patescibacteria group bacterium]